MSSQTAQASQVPAEKIRQSRIGKRAIELPKGVSLNVNADSTVSISGPKGAMQHAVPVSIKVAFEGSKVLVTPTAVSRDSARLQGMTRALLASSVLGVSQGYVRELQLEGTGYRAELKGTTLHLALGFSHPVRVELPKGVSARIPAESKGTLIILEGANKEVMGQLASSIRAIRPPEPYGGKGVRYKGEKVRQKAGKSGGKGK